VANLKGYFRKFLFNTLRKSTNTSVMISGVRIGFLKRRFRLCIRQYLYNNSVHHPKLAHRTLI